MGTMRRTKEGRRTALASGGPILALLALAVALLMAVPADQPLATGVPGSLELGAASHLSVQGPRLSPISSGTWSFNTSDAASISLVAVSGDPGYVAAASTSGHVYLFNISSDQPLGTYSLPAAPTTLSISDRGPAPGTNSLVLASVGPEVYALNLTQPGSFLQAWNFTDNLGYWGKGITNQQVEAVAVDAQSSDVAVLTTFLLNGISGVALAYLVHGVMKWHYIVFGGATPAGMGVAMTPDGTLVALTVNLQGRTSEATIFPYFGTPVLNFTWPGASATAAATALSSDGTHVFLGGNGGFYVGNTADGQSYGGSNAPVFSGVGQIVSAPSGTEFMVETSTEIYAFNAAAMAGNAKGAYASPVWSMPVSTPVPQMLLAGDDPAYFALVGQGAIGSTLSYYYTPMENLSAPAPPYRKVTFPATALDVAYSHDLSTVAVGMQHVAGQALPELEVVLDAGAPPPPGFVVYVYGVTSTSFTVAWGLPGTVVQGFASYTLELYPLPSSGGLISVNSPTATTQTFTGLNPGTTYNVSVTLRSFFGLYQEVAVGSGTTFPAPAQPDPFVWVEYTSVALLLAGAAIASFLLLRSPGETPPPPEAEDGPRLRRQDRGWGARGRPRSSSRGGRRSRRSSRLPPGFG